MKVGKINVDENPNLAAKFRVMSIPTLIIFQDGKPVEQLV
jgi:thioredoxin 1